MKKFQHMQNGRLVAVEKRPLDQGIYSKIQRKEFRLLPIRFLKYKPKQKLIIAPPYGQLSQFG